VSHWLQSRPRQELEYVSIEFDTIVKGWCLLREDKEPPHAGVLESRAAMGVREPDQLGCGGPPGPPGTRGLPPRPMSIVCPVTGLWYVSNCI
jgi:hypothetical protein